MKDKCINAAFICFYLPVFTVIVSYLLSIHFELVSKCIPNLEGCTSISRVGRYPPVNYFFKPMMFVYSISLFFYWFNFFKLAKIEDFIIKLIALFSIISLILYIFFLGEGEIYASFFRKVGVYIYIFFTVLSQYLVSRKIFFQRGNKNYRKPFLKYKYILSLTLVIGGIILLPILIIKIDNFPGIKNIISWNYFLLIQTYFLLSYLYLKELSNPTTT